MDVTTADATGGSTSLMRGEGNIAIYGSRCKRSKGFTQVQPLRRVKGLRPARSLLLSGELQWGGSVGGYAESFRAGGFDRVQLVSPTTQVVQFVMRLGNQVAYDLPPFGNVNGAFSQVTKTVTTSSAP